MLTVDRLTGAFADRMFRDLPSLLQPGDLLVMNDSRVIPARLFGRRAGLRTQANSPAPTGSVEVLLTQPLGGDTWRALVKPGRKVPVGEHLVFDLPAEASPVLTAEVIEAGEYGERILRFDPTADFFATLDRLGHIPLPPYIYRDREGDQSDDRERYQTVYAGAHGSAAAPTAGLHFTPAVLDEVRLRGVEITYITLHVGLGTFQPVRAEDLADIRLHEESYTISEVTSAALLAARAEGRRIVAVGTTTARTLEHMALSDHMESHTGSTRIFIQPGHRFQLVDALLTNFHLPRSTLLMLVSAFAGRDHVMAAYTHAIDHRYRFFSYGDCMFLG